jgi:transmembrane sensor
MGNNNYYTIEDFVFDRSFRNWIITKEPQASEYWETWMKNHADQYETVNNAKAVIYALQINHKQFSEEEIHTEIKKILLKVQQIPVVTLGSNSYYNKSKDRILYFAPRTIAKVAAVLVVVVAVWFVYRLNYSHHQLSGSYTSFITVNKKTANEYFNSSDSVVTIYLPDGSVAYLKHNSKLVYNHGTSAYKREVYLVGAAFFEVKKDQTHPFFVYTNRVVTKVLGTSFSVSAYEGDQKAIVVVKTGKVSVFKSDNFTIADTKANEWGGVVVTPNQSVIFDNTNRELTKTIADKPELIIRHSNSYSFEFDATPVKDVFAVMQHAYGITILYDEDILSHCSLTASMGNEPFYDKLKLICKAINATYEVMDGNVVINAKGCE